jgi:peroxiredoxin
MNAPFSQKAFADFAKIVYPLLSDRDGKVMQAFGVYDEARRLAKRSYIIVDKEGVIKYYDIRPSNSEKDLLSQRLWPWSSRRRRSRSISSRPD